jgi:NAD(P)H-binding
MTVCIVGASGKLGQYMVQQALDRDYEVVAVCREESVGKLDAFKGRITVVPGATDDRAVIERAVAGCDGVLVVLVPRGVHGYSTGTAQAVLDYAPRGARLVFSCGWHITRDGNVCCPRLETGRKRRLGARVTATNMTTSLLERESAWRGTAEQRSWKAAARL